MSKSTASEYLLRLNYFKSFLGKKFSFSSIDTIIKKIKDGDEDPYEVLTEYALYLMNCGISPYTLKRACNNDKELS